MISSFPLLVKIKIYLFLFFPDGVLIHETSLGIDFTDYVNSKFHVVSHGYLAIQKLSQSYNLVPADIQ